MFLGKAELLFCDGRDIVLQVATHVFPCLQALGEQACCARRVARVNVFAVGIVCRVGSGRKVGSGHDGVVVGRGAVALQCCHVCQSAYLNGLVRY
jgi:hypothetical protein